MGNITPPRLNQTNLQILHEFSIFFVLMYKFNELSFPVIFELEDYYGVGDVVSTLTMIEARICFRGGREVGRWGG